MSSSFIALELKIKVLIGGMDLIKLLWRLLLVLSIYFLA